MNTITKAVGLSEAGRRALAKHLAENLKDKYLKIWLAGWEDEVSFDSGFGNEVGHLELRGFDTASGNPVVLSFEDDEVVMEEVELDDEA